MKESSKTGLLLGGPALAGLALGFVLAEGPMPGAEGAAEGDRGAAVLAKSDRIPPKPGARLPIGGGDESVDREFVDWFGKASREEMREAVLAQYEGTFGTSNLRSWLLMRELFRRDPKGSFEYFAPYREEHVNLMMSVFRAWSSLDPRQAAEALVPFVCSTTAGESRNTSLPHQTFLALGKLDPDAALELAQELPRKMAERGAALTALLCGYAEHNPAGMPAMIERVKQAGGDPKNALGPWAHADPDGAVEWARENWSDTESAPSSLLRALADTDPRRAVELHHEFHELDESRGISGLPGRLVGQWMAADYEGALQWLERKAGPERREELLESAFRVLRARDPEIVLSRLLEGDPVAAEQVSWVESLKAVSTSRSAEEMLGLLEQAPGDQTEELRDALAQLGYLEPTREQLAAWLRDRAGHAATSVLLKDPAMVREVLQLVDSEDRDAVLLRLGSEFAEQKPDVVSSLRDLAHDEEAFDGNAAQYGLAVQAQRDPEAAMAAVEEMPAGPARAAGVRNVVHNLILDDPERALHWLSSQRETFVDTSPNPSHFADFVRGLRSSYPWESERIEALLPEESAQSRRVPPLSNP